MKRALAERDMQLEDVHSQLKEQRRAVAHANKQLVHMERDNADRYARCEVAASFHQQNLQLLQNSVTNIVNAAVESKLAATVGKAVEEIKGALQMHFQETPAFKKHKVRLGAARDL